MTLLLVCLSILFSLMLILWVDLPLVKKGIPSLGLIVTLMYCLTYGLGWSLWRLDPSSLFGYRSASTVSSLDRLGYLFAIGLPALVCGYAASRSLLESYFGFAPRESFLAVATRFRPLLAQLSFAVLFLTVIGICGMTATGVFLRDGEYQALQTGLIAKLLVGSGVLSRLAPVGLVLVPLAWPRWSHFQRLAASLLIVIWFIIAFSSGSRGQLLAVPLYLVLGSVVWRRIPIVKAGIFILAGSLIFLPVAENIRVGRAGSSSDPNLGRTFEGFQIGKQLMGTSHEFYLMLEPKQCSLDLHTETLSNPRALSFLLKNQQDLPLDSGERWHHVFLYRNCISRELSLRGFDQFNRLFFLYLPRSVFPASRGLFDGQELVETLSLDLGLRPGEISQGTLSIFADAWWRWRWSGVIAASAVLGAVLALIQSLLLWMMGRRPIVGLLGQLLLLSLVGTWINNTTLTMLWYLLWDLPKAWLELIVLTSLLRFRVPKWTI